MVNYKWLLFHTLQYFSEVFLHRTIGNGGMALDVLNTNSEIYQPI